MLPLLRGLTDVRRTRQSNLRLGAVGQYTSPMTGIVSAMADKLVLGQATAVLAAAAALAAFSVGAMTTAILVNSGLRRQLHRAYFTAAAAAAVVAARAVRRGCAGPPGQLTSAFEFGPETQAQ